MSVLTSIANRKLRLGIKLDVAPFINLIMSSPSEFSQNAELLTEFLRYPLSGMHTTVYPLSNTFRMLDLSGKNEYLKIIISNSEFNRWGGG